jgi:hypothetical protein
MRDVLSSVLSGRDSNSNSNEAESDVDLDVDGTNRILAAAFFRKRPLQAGSSPFSMMSPLRTTYAAPATTRANNVVRLADRRPASAPSVIREEEISGFLGGGKRQ